MPTLIPSSSWRPRFRSFRNRGLSRSRSLSHSPFGHYFGRAAAPYHASFGLVKRRRRRKASTGRTTHIGYKKVRTIKVNGKKRTLYRKKICVGKKRKSSARYRAFKKVKGVQLYVRVTPRRRRRNATLRRRRRRLGFGCSSAYGCGFGRTPLARVPMRFGQHGHYHSLGQIMSPYTAAPAPVAATAAAFGRRRRRRFMW